MTSVIDTNSFTENWSTILLSLRDLRRDVPINYNQYPGIALTPACFSDKRYTSDKTNCVVNLAAIGYRRFVIDLYLHKDSGQWNICPASMRVKDLAANSNIFEALPAVSSAISINSSATSTSLARQTPNVPSPVDVDVDVDGYICNSSFNATTLLSAFGSWIAGTDTDLGARLMLLDFNLQEAWSHPSDTNLPVPGPLLQILQNTSILEDTYTPGELASDRSDLNSSWFGERESGNTSVYFTIQEDEDGHKTTEDGWPSEWYLEFLVKKRVLMSFGEIAAGLGYDPAATGDDKKIFPAGYLGDPAVFNSSTPPTTCFFSNSDFELKDVNSSWAQIIDTASDPFPKNNLGAIMNLTSCGYSTTLNSTYSTNITENIEYYFDQIKDALAWSWDVNELVNTTNASTADTFRCASMSANDGRWRVTECGERKLAACRVKSKPYDWVLTRRDDTYYNAAGACDENDFDAPRSALENAYLLAAMGKARLELDDRIWIDFNSLAVDGCWVTGGANAPCPYEPTSYGDREVIVSAVAAVIILILFGLMWFAKVGSWRVERSRKRRRKMVKKRNLEGIEYEGVPS